jgi:hypothetical protein
MDNVLMKYPCLDYWRDELDEEFRYLEQRRIEVIEEVDYQPLDM